LPLEVGQDFVTSRIAVALNRELISAEAVRPTQHPDAMGYILRGRATYARPPSVDKYAESISLLERALALDLRSVAALSYLAIYLTARVVDNMTDSAAADCARAEELAGRALAALAGSSLAHYAKAQVLRAQGRYDQALPEYETVLGLDRNWVTAYTNIGQCKLYTGSIAETIPLVEQAIRISPRDPQLGIWYMQIGQVHLLQSRTDEAIIWLERARNHTPAIGEPTARLRSADRCRDGHLSLGGSVRLRHRRSLRIAK
jgi:tetratricopeptide (TPR) repeat protein